MKCELCHQKDAETAIVLNESDEERELYVCRACAKRERMRRQKKSQRTRKASGLPPGMSISVTRLGVDGAPPPPFVEALMNAVRGVVGAHEERRQDESKAKPEPEYRDFPCSRVEAPYRVGGRLHLEGLHLIGELEAVHRAMHALDIRLVGNDVDGVHDAGHVFSLQYTGSHERARRAAAELVEQERNARTRLATEMPRVFGDSMCRALAVMKNCRLLSPGELFDLLSPLRLAAIDGLLDGIGLREIEKMMAGCDLSPRGDDATQEERDRADAELADEVNGRFEDVVLGEDAEGRFL